MTRNPARPAPPTPAPDTAPDPALDPARFRRALMPWYRRHARILPWRGIDDPYRTWISETMLQQTRVAAVVEHYHRFLHRFPTLHALAGAPEADVLAAWSGLGYYRRARMLHRAARTVVAELDGRIPGTFAALRHLPGIGDYTAAAIASIAFGESVAVLDGNVERVLLRLTGRPADPTAAGRAFLRRQAAALLPARSSSPSSRPNAFGDHNQAVMELGATVCLPRAPLCLHCPVHALCRTRGEHPTTPRPRPLTRPAAFLLHLRGDGPARRLLLERRPPTAGLMPGMWELPPLPLTAVVGRRPLLRLRHAITTTLYAVEVHRPAPGSDDADDDVLAAAVPPRDLAWTPLARLAGLPLTGLARKTLLRLHLLASPPPRPTV